MGVVYRATDEILGREVAIKTFTKGLLDREEMRQRFLGEGRSLARLSHPNIVTIHEFSFQDEDPYIVMELVKGKSLQKLIDSKLEIPMAGRVRLVRDVCETLAYAHGLQVIHRDIKPANIFVQPDGQIKLLDFGIAQMASSDRAMTRAGSVIGSMEYVAPERIRGEVLDGRADVFSAGVVLYQLLTGQVPFAAETEYALMQKIVAEAFPPLPEVSGLFPASLSDAVARALAKSPNDRFQSADAMAAALSTVLDGMGTKTVEASSVWFVRTLTPPPEAPEAPTPAAFNPSAPAPSPFRNTAPSVVQSVGVTHLSAVPAPTGFLSATVVSRTRFFQGDQVRYEKIEDTLSFYREHLSKDYEALSSQAQLTYYLWITSVVIGLGALVCGLILLFRGQIQAGSVSTIGAAFVYFIQKVFQQREDHYRELASGKQKNLEYGNHWLLVIQSIDAIENAEERERRQSDLVKVLTGKLGGPELVPAAKKKTVSKM